MATLVVYSKMKRLTTQSQNPLSSRGVGMAFAVLFLIGLCRGWHKSRGPSTQIACL